MNKKEFQVVLIEDEPLTRKRLTTVIEQHPELTVIATASNCSQGRKMIKTNKPDVLLVDLGLPDGHGTELIHYARNVSPNTNIMVITVFGDEKNVISAIEAGATGYLLKDGDTSYIGQSIKQVLDGGSPISAAIARHLLKRFNQSAQQDSVAENAPKLTEREQQVLGLISKGFSYAEIARILEISVNTTNTHIKHIYHKLSVNSRGEAVFEAVQLGLIQNLN